jgi:NTP pyrophosphatase (non-canonical NTP hydrolase)
MEDSMTPNEYQQKAQRTCLADYEKFKNNLMAHHRHIIHAHLGLSSETGEVGDAIKKYIIYGQPLDVDNLIEECGDILWYLSLMVSACGSTLESVMEQNIAKLEKRYPEKFTEKDAFERKDKV